MRTSEKRLVKDPGPSAMFVPGFSPISRIEVNVFRIPTETEECDGTLCWEKTELVLVKVYAGDACGCGYTYSDMATAMVIKEHLYDAVIGRNAFDIISIWKQMQKVVRNIGSRGVAASAISAVDNALWDLKARLLDLPLVSLLGAAHGAMELYGSGGFTNYDIDHLQRHLLQYVENGFKMVKIKVGNTPEKDPDRVAAARNILGTETRLFVDANGAYSVKQAMHLAQVFKDQAVSWFEEPVSSDDLQGLRRIRDHAPADMQIAAGEYGYDAFYFRHMLEHQAVDVLQLDVTRCAGITGLLRAASLAEVHNIPVSAHTAPMQHLHVCCAVPNMLHMEYFYDHARIEHMLFDSNIAPVNGRLIPDLSVPGAGLEFKDVDAEQYRVI